MFTNGIGLDMRRGRPNVRHEIQREIIILLSKFSTPLTTSIILRETAKTINREVSWNTIQKYVNELVESGKVQAVQLPHSKVENKLGLVVYTLKK